MKYSRSAYEFLSCLGYVEENWTDLRPRSLREAMAAGSAGAESAGE
ncbi:hypothetical protein [Streptomyces sp. NPDC058953]